MVCLSVWPWPWTLVSHQEIAMQKDHLECVLLADRHHGLSEGIRGLLETMFDAVIMVADETSLQESAARIHPSVAVVDLALAPVDGLGVVRRLRERCPDLTQVLLTAHDEASACRAVLKAGANAVVLKRDLASDLLPAIEAVQEGRSYVSPRILAPTRPGAAAVSSDE